jgi:hypothetical protein
VAVAEVLDDSGRHRRSSSNFFAAVVSIAGFWSPYMYLDERRFVCLRRWMDGRPRLRVGRSYGSRYVRRNRHRPVLKYGNGDVSILLIKQNPTKRSCKLSISTCSISISSKIHIRPILIIQPFICVVSISQRAAVHFTRCATSSLIKLINPPNLQNNTTSSFKVECSLVCLAPSLRFDRAELMDSFPFLYFLKGGQFPVLVPLPTSFPSYSSIEQRVNFRFHESLFSQLQTNFFLPPCHRIFCFGISLPLSLRSGDSTHATIGRHGGGSR